ncbi:MAG: glycosyltransferase family 4 protein [Patescibacteria group bacterium]
MNIAINTLPLSTEHRMRGTGVYTKNLIDALLKYEKGHTYSFFTRVEDILKKTDVVHYPFFDPFFLTLPFFKHYPTVVTVHDMIPLLFPDKFPPGIRGRVKWQIQRLSLMGAAAIVTDSRSSKKDIAKLTGKQEEKIHVVPLAPSPSYKRVTDEQRIRAMRQRYHLPEEYVLYVGDVNWNKNVTGLLAAWKLTRAKLSRSRNTTLVLAGSAFSNTELRETRDILQLITSLGIGKHVIRPGFIRDEDMSALYSGARSVVLPSWYEGFGFPVIEAMMCGVPVVASDRGSIPEISGPALSADPGNTGELARAIRQSVMLPPKERKQLVKNEMEWAKQFTWKRVAKETASVYASLS